MNSLCPAPWDVLYIGPQGEVRLCFESSQVLGNVNAEGLEEIWQSDALNSIREKMLQGQSVSACEKCYAKEVAIAGQSLRTMLLHQLGAPTTLQAPLRPKYLDIALSAECNLACRSCGPHYSTRWQREEGLQLKSMNLVEILTQLDLGNLERVTMAGGEPWLQHDHETLLKFLIDQQTRPITLEYNSNATVSPLRFFELWKHFSRVKISLSLDATDERFHYMRYPGKFSKVQEIISILRQSDLPIDLTSYSTISVMNIDHLPQLITALIEDYQFEPDQVELHYLVTPSIYNLQGLNLEAKVRLSEKIMLFIKGQLLQNYDWVQVQGLILRLKMIVNYMNERQLEGQSQGFWREVQRLDQMRGQSGLEVFPEWSHLISP